MADHPATTKQLSTGLPSITAYLTGHDYNTGETIVFEERPALWQPIDNKGMAFNVPFTTTRFPPSMKDNIDVVEHDARLSAGKLGIVNPNGTVLRFVDFAPQFESMMHRTRSLDFGMVVEGCIELILDSGAKRTLRRGDACVQRGTDHVWRNPSDSEWARVVYAIQDAEPLNVNGEELQEYLGRSEGEIPSSRQ